MLNAWTCKPVGKIMYTVSDDVPMPSMEGECHPAPEIPEQGSKRRKM
jgi:hypothetical protein